MVWKPLWFLISSSTDLFTRDFHKDNSSLSWILVKWVHWHSFWKKTERQELFFTDILNDFSSSTNEGEEFDDYRISSLLRPRDLIHIRIDVLFLLLFFFRIHIYSSYFFFNNRFLMWIQRWGKQSLWRIILKSKHTGVEISNECFLVRMIFDQTPVFILRTLLDNGHWFRTKTSMLISQWREGFDAVTKSAETT